jgi:hypothetical protein
VFDAAFADKSFYHKDRLIAHEEGAGDFEARWHPIVDFSTGEKILYPPGMLDLLD